MRNVVQGEMTVDTHFNWEYHHHYLQVTTHRKLMQPGGSGGGGGGIGGGGIGGGGGPGAATGPASSLVLAATGAEFAPSEFYTSYEIDDADSGTVVAVAVNATHRNIESNAIPAFDVGQTTFPESDPFLISEQELSVSLPLTPTYNGLQSRVLTSGVTVLGIKLEPGTGERVTCDDGVTLTVEVCHPQSPLLTRNHTQEDDNNEFAPSHPNPTTQAS